MNTKLHSPKPWFFLTGLLALVPVANNSRPALFFPALPAPVVSTLAVFGGVYTAVLAFARLWAVLQRRDKARALVGEVSGDLSPRPSASENDLGQSGRLITRLVRNVEVDLGEIRPDFSIGSLSRLKRIVPALLEEVLTEEDARIRLGIVGVYLGETLCRSRGWQWDFRARPDLRQFTYQASRVVKDGRSLEVFTKAAGLMTGKADWGGLLREIGG
ncbi:MAG TPA: hypothetical protein VHE12_11290 [bacterium]|nr:hypothetical protein [bacterium]